MSNQQIDLRNRDSVFFAPMMNMPFMWTYDFLRPYSFRKNRALWGTGAYNYYDNYFNGVNYDDYYYDEYY